MTNIIKEKNMEFFNIETGEVLTVGEVVKEYFRGDTIKRTNQMNGLKKKKLKEELYNYLDCSYGSFSFNRYKNLIDSFTNEEKFNGDDCFKFMYLVTFIDYNNKLRYGSKYGYKHRSVMTERDLPEVLRISSKQAGKVKKRLVDIGAINIESDGSISVNSSIVTKGKLNKNYRQQSVRIFENTVKELYENCTIRQHSRLSIFIKLLLFINIYHNLICFNPNEKEVRLIKPMSMTDICRELGLNVSKSKRIEDDLFKIKVAGEYIL